MVKELYLLCCFSLLCLWTSCTSKTPSAEENEWPFHPQVEAFTSGKISRYTPVYLIFNEEIAPEKRTAAILKKRIHIRPDIAGEFFFENGRTLVFKPSKSFERNTTYQVTADLSDWFGSEGKEKEFSFTFTTLPLAVRADLESFDMNPRNENGYDITTRLYTPDREQPETVESLIRFSEKAIVEWQHSPDGKKHQATLKNVPAGTSGTRTLTLSVGPNKQGVSEEELLAIPVPDQNDFSVYDVAFVSEPERYVEVTFTKALDDTQDLQGLAFLNGQTSSTVHAEGNKLRLYPDAESSGSVNVHLNKGIRSKSGLTLKEDIIRQVELTIDLPDVRFIGKGVIIPQSSRLTVPFQAIYLRGVIVRVIKIFEQNIGEFLQVNQLDETQDLMRVGRLIARKTIFLDEEGADLTRWNTFALDLQQLIEPEPGAIYRLELSFDQDLSVYPCNDSIRLTKEQLQAKDAIKFNEEINRFDGGGYYYYTGETDWSEYNYKERNNPCNPSYYLNKVAGKNVLATNLGLMAMAGEADKMTVLVHNLLDTKPEKGVKVTAYNYQNQELSSGLTDEKGQVELTYPSGKPFYLIASSGEQRSYLRVDDGSALSLSSFDVSGEVVQKGIKGFIYGDRGVWRPGDTLYMGFMLNDAVNRLPAHHPVVMELYNPLGQLYTRQTQTQGILGTYAFALPTEADAPTGAWNIKVDVGGTSFEKRVRIETIKPNRLKIDLSIPEKVLLRGEPLDARLHVEWLQGATARNLKYEIRGTFVSAPTHFPGYKDFTFDNPGRIFKTEESKLITGQTDAEGNAVVKARFEAGASAPGMLKINLITRVFEESGDFSIDGTLLNYSPYRRYAGIRSPQQGQAQLNTGTTYTYDVASVDYLGRPVSDTKLEINIYKVSWYWWWDADRSNLANYMSDSYNKPVKTLTIRTDKQGRGTFPLSFDRSEWGTYLITVKDPESQHTTGIMSYYDWPDNEGRRNADGSEAANLLKFKTDKDVYKPGEQMIITIPSVKGGRAIVSIETGSRLLSVSEYTCEDKETTLKLDVTSDMQPNAYVYITLLQPHGLTQNDLPIRLYGVVPFTVTSAESHLHPVIQIPAEIKPQNTYHVTISEKEGREMAYTLAIVDEGLLDLTHFATPEPWKAFNAREALGVHNWDLYNYVVGAYSGRIEQLFSIGGDDALNNAPKAIVNRFRPVVQFDGPFLLKKGQKQQHTYTMPNYNGRVRVMVVAGNGTAYGHADRSVLVRKPVMLLGTLPRVIGVGEEMVIPATVFATENGVGKVTVTVTSSPNMEIIGPSNQTLEFTEKADKQALFRIRVKDKPGTGRITLTATSKNDRAVYATDIEIRSIRNPQVKVIPVTLEGGKNWKQTLSLPGADGTNQLRLEVSDVRPLNLSSRLAYLLGYPHGCVEQIISKAFPQLYLKEFMALTSQQESATEEVVKEVIRRLRSYQTTEGAFSYWPGGTGSNGWGTVYATHFLLAAESKGYLVPQALKQNALNNLRLVGRNWKPVPSVQLRSEEMTQAYRLYVLALAGQPEIGAMNRLKESRPGANPVRWMLASAYALVGRTDVAQTLIKETLPQTTGYNGTDETFGSTLRDQAIYLMTLTLLNEGTQAAAIADEISRQLGSDEWLSTQSTAFALISLSAFREKYPVSGTMDFTYTCAGQTETVRTDKNVWSRSLLEKAGSAATLEVSNNGKSPLFLRVITEGIPVQGEEKAYANGLSLAVSYVDASGQPVNITDLPQGTNFTAVATVKNPTARDYNYIVLSEIFPAGWEILNTRFLDASGTDPNPVGVSYQDIRDDRVYSYIDRLPAGRQVTVRIPLCAVYPGRFYLPSVTCQAMYDYLIRANTQGRYVTVR